MKIQLASDLHLEFVQRAFPGERIISPAYEADVLVLAGDIANGTQAIDLFKDWPVPVLYVAGNHEFYGHSLEETRASLSKTAEDTSIRFLDNQVADFGGARFLGCTFWTDYRLLGDHYQSAEMLVAEECLNDHRQIRAHGEVFSAACALREHEQSRAWLQRELAKPYDGKTIVVTHHGPHPKSIHSRYRNSLANSAFVSKLDELLKYADFWLHGHVHDNFDYIEQGCRVIVNPLGYAKNRYDAISAKALKFENPLFKWACVVDLNEIGVSPPASPTEGSTQVATRPIVWVCTECANRYLGPAIVHSHTYHVGICDLCLRERRVASRDDFYP